MTKTSEKSQLWDLLQNTSIHKTACLRTVKVIENKENLSHVEPKETWPFQVMGFLDGILKHKNDEPWN